jgi:hypothetical protein
MHYCIKDLFKKHVTDVSVIRAMTGNRSIVLLQTRGKSTCIIRFSVEQHKLRVCLKERFNLHVRLYDIYSVALIDSYRCSEARMLIASLDVGVRVCNVKDHRKKSTLCQWRTTYIRGRRLTAIRCSEASAREGTLLHSAT